MEYFRSQCRFFSLTITGQVSNSACRVSWNDNQVLRGLFMRAEGHGKFTTWPEIAPLCAGLQQEDRATPPGRYPELPWMGTRV